MGYVAAGRLEEGLVAGLSLTEHLILARPEKQFFIDWPGNRAAMTERIATYQIVGQPETTADALFNAAATAEGQFLIQAVLELSLIHI